MPGPINKKKRKPRSKNKNKTVSREVQPVPRSSATTTSIPSPSPPPTELPTPPPYVSNEHPIPSPFDDVQNNSYTLTPHSEPPSLEKPFIYDPGNGPRVRNTRAFLASKFFAQPPAWDVRTCFYATALRTMYLWSKPIHAGSTLCRICSTRSTWNDPDRTFRGISTGMPLVCGISLTNCLPFAT